MQGVAERECGRGTPRAEDAQGTPTQSHIPPSILVYEDKQGGSDSRVRGVQMRVAGVQERGAPPRHHAR